MTKPGLEVHGSSRHPRIATMLSARAAYVAVILLATLADLNFDPDMQSARYRLYRALHPWLAWFEIVDGLRNILLFAGFGAVWLVTSRTGRLRDALWRATLYGFLLSTAVEAMQLFSPTRVSSVLDVFTNTTGSLGGALGAGIIVAAIRVRRGANSYLGVPAFILALGQVAAILAEAFTPLFRQGMVPYVYGGPVIRLRTALLFTPPFSIWRIPRADLLLALPAGFLAFAAIAEVGVATATTLIAVAVLATALSFLAEIAHGSTGELVLWEAVFAHAAGMTIGAFIAWRSLPAFMRRFREERRAGVFFIAYALTMIAWSWRPFIPRTGHAEILAEFSREHWIPLRSLALRGDIFTVGHVVQMFALTLPLGAMLAVWPLRERGALRWVLPVVWMAAVLELAHGLIAGRTFDVTNFLIQGAGGWMGWWLVRRAGFTAQGQALSGT